MTYSGFYVAFESLTAAQETKTKQPNTQQNDSTAPCDQN